jgi:hypothetical protein
MGSSVRHAILLCFGLFLMLLSASAQVEMLSCPSDKSEKQSRKYAGYTVSLETVSKQGERCRAVVKPPNSNASDSKAAPGKTVARDWTLAINPLSGTDINGDGKPELILQGYSGGAHCCYTYRIVSLRPGLPVLQEIRNQVPASFVKRDDGSIEITTGEGVFDFFLVPHSESVIPKVFFRLEGNKLVDTGGAHLAEYDKEIEEARSQLTPAELDKLKKSTYNQNMFLDQLPTVRKVLTIVLDYLYSGREEQAWQALDEMWPPSDVTRVKSLIQERRARGLLFQAKAKAASGH